VSWRHRRVRYSGNVTVRSVDIGTLSVRSSIRKV
jgi:hypothetical protein